MVLPHPPYSVLEVLPVLYLSPLIPDTCLTCGHPGYDGHDMRSVPPRCLTCDCGREACTDCGLSSDDPCPYGALTCSECSLVRERVCAGLSDLIPPCAAHGEYLEVQE
jgi:hypothetical protein